MDIGPGFGAQLALWKSRFHFEKITALEPNHKSWQRARSHESSRLDVLCERLETFKVRRGIDCAVAVDSCYHIPYDVLWKKLLEIPTLSIVVLSDLFLLRTPTLGERLFLRFTAFCARIPYKNFRRKDQYLLTTGMLLDSWEDASIPVVDGFCNFVRSEISGLSLFQKVFNAQVLKVYCTYLLLRRLRSKGLIGYAVASFRPKQ